MLKTPSATELLHQLETVLRKHIASDCKLAGIDTGGYWVAQWLSEKLQLVEPPARINASFHRDDLRPQLLRTGRSPSSIQFDIAGAHILLIDDVLHTGRTIRAALSEIFDFGRPASVKLAVLVDRGGRELPITPDYSAIQIMIPAQQSLVLDKSVDGSLQFTLTDK